MITINEIREREPSLNHLSDEDLIDAVHQKYYSHVPKEKFVSKINFNTSEHKDNNDQASVEQPKSSESMQPVSKKTTGLMGIGRDLIDALNQAAYEVPQGIMNLPGEVGASAQHIAKHPIRSGVALGSGVLEGIKALHNLGPSITKYLGDKELPVFKQLAPFAEKSIIGNTGLKEKILGKEQPGERFISGIGSFIGPYKGAGFLLNPGLRRTVAAAAIPAISEKENPITAAISASLLHGAGKVAGYPLAKRGKKRLLEGELTESKDLAENQQNSLDQLVSELHKKYGAKTPDALERQRFQAQQNIEELRPKANIPFEQTEKMLPGSTGETLIESSRKPVESSERNIKTLLGENLSHDERFTQALKQDQKNIINDYKSKYDDFVDNKIDKLNISVPRQGVLEKIEQEVRNSLGSKLLLSDDQVKTLVDKIAEKDKQSEMSGRELYEEWKNVRDLGHLAIDRSRNAKTSGERNEYYSTGRQLLNQASDLLDFLDKHLGPENAKYLKKLNQGYKEQVIEPRSNSTYRQAMGKKGLVSGDILDKSKGIGSGTEHLRKRMLENPELLNHALGQRYSAKPRDLLNANETASKFINKHPVLGSLKDRLSEAIENESKSRAKAKELSDEAKRVESEWEEINKKQIHAKGARQQIERLTEFIHKISFDLQALEKELQNKSLTDEQVKLKEAKLEKLKSSLKNTKEVIKTIAKVGIVGLVGTKLTSIIGKLIK